MKQRFGFVSNSSSSSFLVPFDAFEKYGVRCIKLSDEIVKCLEQYFKKFNGDKADFSKSKDWWLTEMVSDCMEQCVQLCDDDEAIEYLNGNDAPYGWYDENGEKRYVCLHGNDDYTDFYIAIGDLIGREATGEVPQIVRVKFVMEKILKSKALNKTQKLGAIEDYFNTL